MRLGRVTALVAFLFFAFWAAGLGTDQCGNEDTVECTPLGWFLLYGWMLLFALLAGLLLYGAGRFVWRRLR